MGSRGIDHCKELEEFFKFNKRQANVNLHSHLLYYCAHLYGLYITQYLYVNGQVGL